MTLADSLRRLGFGLKGPTPQNVKYIRLTDEELQRVRAIAQELGISEAQTVRALTLKALEGEAMAIGGHYEGSWWVFDDAGMTRDDLFDLQGYVTRQRMHLPESSDLRIKAHNQTLTDEETAQVKQGLTDLVRRHRLGKAWAELADGVEVDIGWGEAARTCPHEVVGENCKVCGASKESVEKWRKELEG